MPIYVNCVCGLIFGLTPSLPPRSNSNDWSRRADSAVDGTYQTRQSLGHTAPEPQLTRGTHDDKKLLLIGHETIAKCRVCRLGQGL